MLPYLFDKRASVLAVSCFSFMTVALQAQEGVRLSTPTFGFQTEDKSPDGKRYAYLYDSSGNVLKTIPADACMAAPGRLGGYMLLDYQVIDSQRKLEVYDDQGKLKGSFDMDARMEPLLGKQAVALLVFNEHGLFRPYEITFVDATGNLLAQHLKKARLITLRQFENDHWVADSLNPDTDTVVLDHFDPVGKLVWSYDTKQEDSWGPTIAISSSGAQTAISLFVEEPRGGTLTLLDEKGVVSLGLTKVPRFQRAAYSPNEEYVALAGSGVVQLRKTTDGALVWEDRSRLQTVRNGLKWSSDGSGVYVLTLKTDENGDPASVVVAQYSISSSVPLLEKTVIETPVDTSTTTIDFFVDDPLTITVISSTGRITVNRS